MISQRDYKVLKKLLFETKDILDFTKNFTFEKFIKDGKTKKAVAMSMINMGELVKLLSDEFKLANSNMPFKAITTTRHIAAHEYQELRFDYIWEAIQKDIPDLKTKIEKLLK